MKLDPKEIGCEGLDWIHIVQERSSGRTL